jgi:hypothetical protein
MWLPEELAETSIADVLDAVAELPKLKRVRFLVRTRASYRN